MKKQTIAIACAASMLACLLSAFPATAQSDWTSFFTYQNTTFYYSPGSVSHNGSLVNAKWHDSNNLGLVYLAQIDCSARTIQSLSVDRYDAQTGAFIQTVDLSGQSAPQQIGPYGTMAGNLAQATC